jgi:hypothetical protein
VLLLILVLLLMGCARSALRRADGDDVVSKQASDESAHLNESMVASQAGASQATGEYALKRSAQQGQQEQQGQRGQENKQSGGQQTRLSPSMVAASSTQAAAQAAERKIIRNAEITMEVDAPDEGQRKIATIAERYGGFVVISESSQSDAAKSQAAPAAVVNIVVRVPAQKFEAAIEEIRGVAGSGGRVLHDKRSGQDVTEEYIDLEARVRTKRALEAQFLEIMKQARKVSDALEVQTQLADVRTEIEQIEGRRRFLENQSALSTITVSLRTPTPVVAATTRGFLSDLKAAFGDGVDAAAEIVLSVIRFVILMVPITLFILLPCWFAFKWLRRRIPWPARAPAAPPQ